MNLPRPLKSRITGCKKEPDERKVRYNVGSVGPCRSINEVKIPVRKIIRSSKPVKKVR